VRVSCASRTRSGNGSTGERYDQVKIVSAGATDIGKRRANNEDAYLLNDELQLYAAADGVGGNEGGEIASRIAVDTLASVLPDLLSWKDRTPPAGVVPGSVTESDALERAVTFANRAIRQEREGSAALADMGTTLTVLLLRNGRAYLAHVGDSRAYLLRDGTLRQITNDHSLVAEQVRLGVLTPEQAKASPNRHVITRALGLDEELQVDLPEMDLQKGDVILLCTDGLTEMVDDRKIASILANAGAREAAAALIKEANSRGGRDNITAIVVQVAEV
jgi:serine/threonine protein phosphatase PrpC